MQDVPACQLAYHRPSDTVQGVISSLHAFLLTLRTSVPQSLKPEPTAHFVDRSLVGKHPSNNK